MKKSLFLAVLLMILAGMAAAQNYNFSATAPSGQTLYYRIIHDSLQFHQVAVVRNSNDLPTGNLVIPDTVHHNGTTYTVIGFRTFDPYGVFTGATGLTSVVLPDSLERLEGYTFDSCINLRRVQIGSGLTTIYDYAFSQCTSLDSVIIPNNVRNLNTGVFNRCTSLTSIVLSDSLRSIGSDAFAHCTSLGSITLPDSLRRIGGGAFDSCVSLAALHIPAGVYFIGDYAFRNCHALVSLTVDPANPTLDSRDSCNALIHTSTNSLAFGCQTSTIPASVDVIEGWAFAFCQGLTSIVIPDHVTYLGLGAFESCTNLATVVVGDGVTELNRGLFIRCSGLTDITLGYSVNAIDAVAFTECTAIDTIRMMGMPPAIYSHTFEYVSPDATVIVPCGAIADYQQADNWDYFNNFTDDCVQIAVAVNDSTMGRVACSGHCSVGSLVTLTAIAAPGYHFVGWDNGITDFQFTFEVTGPDEFKANFAADSTLGIAAAEALDCALYPNPAYDKVTLAVSGADGPVGIAVIDMSGRVVYQQKLDVATTTFDLQSSAFPKGAYFVRVTCNEGNIVKKLIIR